jgi:hypothetical protein
MRHTIRELTRDELPSRILVRLGHPAGLVAELERAACGEVDYPALCPTSNRPWRSAGSTSQSPPQERWLDAMRASRRVR